MGKLWCFFSFLNVVCVNSRVISTWGIFAILFTHTIFGKQLNTPINSVSLWDGKEQLLRE